MRKLICISVAAAALFVGMAANAQSAAPTTAPGAVAASEAAAAIPAPVIAPGKNTVDAF